MSKERFKVLDDRYLFGSNYVNKESYDHRCGMLTAVNRIDPFGLIVQFNLYLYIYLVFLFATHWSW